MAIFPYPNMMAPGSTKQTFPAPQPVGVISNVQVRPNNSDADKFDANLLSDGRIVQKSLNGSTLLGYINPSGDYYLVNGFRGNTFEDHRVKVGDGYQEKTNPFLQAFKAGERLRAMKGSEIPRIRQNLTRQGLNGAGLTVGILDMRREKPDGIWEFDDHGRAVTAIIQDPAWGIAPATAVVDCGMNTVLSESKTSNKDNVQAFNAALINTLCRNYQIRAQQIQSLIQTRNPSLRVLSDTESPCRTNLYNNIWEKINARQETWAFKYPALRAAILGGALNGTERQQQDAMVNYLDQLLDHSVALSNAHNQYIEATRQAAQAGLTIVVAMMNNRGLNVIPYHKPGSEMANFAQSPYVIAVAACNTHQAPGNQRVYQVAPFSSRGDGYLWNPTITAPGAEMPTSCHFGHMARNYTLEGTSFSAPYVAGVIAMMLQRNPNLSFEQIKAKLQSTATPIPGATVAEQGAGVLNPEAAVLG